MYFDELILGSHVSSSRFKFKLLCCLEFLFVEHIRGLQLEWTHFFFLLSSPNLIQSAEPVVKTGESTSIRFRFYQS